MSEGAVRPRASAAHRPGRAAAFAARAGACAAVCAMIVGCKGATSSGDAPAPSAAIEPPLASAPAPPASSIAAALPLPSATGSPSARDTAVGLVKLLDAGDPPRRKLRYAWHVDQKEQLSMDMRTAASTRGDAPDAGTKGDDVPLPTVHVVIAIDPQSVTADGDMRYAWTVTSTKVDAEEGTPAQVTEGMSAQVAAIAHLSGSAVVTARGLTREIATDPGTPGQMVDQVQQTLRDVAAPFPEEEVGVGARWRKSSRLDDRDARVAQSETFRLVKLEDERGSLDDALAQTAPPQALHAPGQAAGSHARMESMLASGEAKIRFDLSRLVPQTAFDGTTKMVLSGAPPGDVERSLRMVMHVFIGITGSRR
jgi:hypothetical protein